MSYTEDAVQAKLSGLNETQESIVTVAQWIMFHRRHAERTASLWRDHMKTLTANKRLNMIYLANEIVQQSKIRRKDEFLNAFSPIIADATDIAYKGASTEIQNKIRRVMDVWKQRMTFEAPVIEAIEAKVSEADQLKASTKKSGLGGSLFGNSASGSSVPTDLQPLVGLHSKLTKAETRSKPALMNAATEFEQVTGTQTSTVTLPVKASKLGNLLKLLATADTTIKESIKAQEELIVGLEKLIGSNKEALVLAREKQSSIEEQTAQVEDQKRQVEDSIMQGLSSAPVGEAQHSVEGEASGPSPDDEPRPLPQPPVAIPNVSDILASIQASQSIQSADLSSVSEGEGKQSSKRRQASSSPTNGTDEASTRDNTAQTSQDSAASDSSRPLTELTDSQHSMKRQRISSAGDSVDSSTAPSQSTQRSELTSVASTT